MEILKKYILMLISFLAFNFWWILSFLASGAIASAQKIYTPSFAKSWLDSTVSSYGAIVAKMFSLTTIIGSNPSYDFFSYWYGTIFAKLIVFVPIFIIIYFGLIKGDKKTRGILSCAVFAVALVILFFAKGNAAPFAFVYNFMFLHVPFFYMFKSSVEKFGILYVFILSILFIFVMSGTNSSNHKYYKLASGAFALYLIFCSVPMLTGNIISDYNIGELGYASRKYKDKAEYKQARALINNDDFQYRVLSFPGSGNYQVCMSNWNHKFYTGLDPVIMNINKPAVTSYSGLDMLDPLFHNVVSTNYKKLLGVLNIRKVMINEDIAPWFGFAEKESIAELKDIFSKFMVAREQGSITLYDNRDNFLPRIYGVTRSR